MKSVMHPDSDKSSGILQLLAIITGISKVLDKINKETRYKELTLNPSLGKREI
jgi:hypothetical protein